MLNAAELKFPTGNQKGAVLVMRYAATALLSIHVMRLLMELCAALGFGYREPWGVLVDRDPQDPERLIWAPVDREDGEAFALALNGGGRNRGSVNLYQAYIALRMRRYSRDVCCDVPVWVDAERQVLVVDLPNQVQRPVHRRGRRSR